MSVVNKNAIIAHALIDAVKPVRKATGSAFMWLHKINDQELVDALLSDFKDGANGTELTRVYNECVRLRQACNHLGIIIHARHDYNQETHASYACVKAMFKKTIAIFVWWVMRDCIPEQACSMLGTTDNFRHAIETFVTVSVVKAGSNMLDEQYQSDGETTSTSAATSAAAAASSTSPNNVSYVRTINMQHHTIEALLKRITEQSGRMEQETRLSQRRLKIQQEFDIKFRRKCVKLREERRLVLTLRTALEQLRRQVARAEAGTTHTRYSFTNVVGGLKYGKQEDD